MFPCDICPKILKTELGKLQHRQIHFLKKGKLSPPTPVPMKPDAPQPLGFKVKVDLGNHAISINGRSFSGVVEVEPATAGELRRMKEARDRQEIKNKTYIDHGDINLGVLSGKK